MITHAQAVRICGERGFSGLRDWERQNKKARADFARRIKAGEAHLRPLLESLETEWREIIAPNVKS